VTEKNAAKMFSAYDNEGIYGQNYSLQLCAMAKCWKRRECPSIRKKIND
jgi:hypothetical protein